MRYIHHNLFIAMLFFCSCISVYADPGYRDQVKQLIEKKEAPEGIVFEIVNRDKYFLNLALPEVAYLSKKLRIRFPGLSIIVVSHGNEMFSLTRENQNKNPEMLEQLQSLSGEGISVHVCGTLAEIRKVDHSEFPSNVEVAVSGPTEIEKYMDLGFVHIKISNKKNNISK